MTRHITFLLLLSTILVTTTTTTYAYLNPLEDGEDENDERELDENDTTPRGFGQPCGTNKACAYGFDCVRLPVKRICMPLTCGAQAMRDMISHTGFDLGGYGELLMDEAGVDNRSTMFRQFPDGQLNLFNQDSEDMEKMKLAIVNNRPPIEYFLEAFKNCTNWDDEATNPGLTPYFGGSWELGLCGTYNGDVYYGIGSSDTEGMGFLNNCLGVVLGLDAGVSGLVGLGFTGTIADLDDCKLMFPIADFPPFGIQLGFIAGNSPVFLMEFTAGLSASIGLPGFTSCATTAL